MPPASARGRIIKVHNWLRIATFLGGRIDRGNAIMLQSSNCDRCRLFAHSPYLICAVHPAGPTTNPCPDFEALSPEQRVELKAGYYSGDWLPIPTGEVMDEGSWLAFCETEDRLLDFWTAEDLPTECDR